MCGWVGAQGWIATGSNGMAYAARSQHLKAPGNAAGRQFFAASPTAWQRPGFLTYTRPTIRPVPLSCARRRAVHSRTSQRCTSALLKSDLPPETCLHCSMRFLGEYGISRPGDRVQSAR